jgi:ATPase subunit of ABC transporter with duplicated ATPase domains
MLIFFWSQNTPIPVPVVVPDNETKYGGGQEAFERYKAERRKRLADAERRKDELKARLVKAEQDRERKARAKAEAKSRKAIEARIEKTRAEIIELDILITQLIEELELSIHDRKRRLLLLTLVM